MAIRSVYVSSTFRDLKEHREIVNDTVRRMGLVDVAMEHYNAESDPPLEVCVRDVQESDVYVGIFAWRHGVVTEAEYRAAQDAGLPCLIFLLHEDADWPRSRMDKDPTAIEALRDELERARTLVYYHSGKELGQLVATSLHQLVVEQGGEPMPGAGLDPELVAGYFRRLDQEYGGLDLAALTPPEHDDSQPLRLQAVYIEPDVREDPPPVDLPRELLQRLRSSGDIDEAELPEGVTLEDVRAAQDAYRAKPRQALLGAVTRERCAVVLGDPGAGKSTLARLLVLDLISPEVVRVPTLAGHLPVLIELRDFATARSRGVRGILDFVHERAEAGLGLPRPVLEPYLAHDGPALVVFDGLDEVFDPAERDEITRQIAGFAEHHPSARVLVTSRTWGYQRRRLTDAGFAHLALQDFDRRQIGDFLTTWYERVLADRIAEAHHRRDQLLTVVDSSAPILELAGNPLLLTVLAIIGKGQQLPRERWRAYEQATRVLVENWDVSRHLRINGVVTDFITEDDKRELLRRLAWGMQTGEFGRAGNYIHRTELQRLFEGYLVERYQQPPARAKSVAVAMIEQFRHRDFILSRWGPDLYAFVHRAFLEFFCADALLQRFQHQQTLTLDALGDLYLARCPDPTWHEILRLLASRLAEPHSARIVRRLLDLDHPWPISGFSAPPAGVALAVQCLTELRNLRATPEVAEAAAAVLTEVVLLLEHNVGRHEYGGTRCIEIDVLPVARHLGTTWPGREEYAAWYARRGVRLVWSPVTEVAARLLAVLFADDPEILSTTLPLTDSNDNRVWNALAGVAEELAAGDDDPVASRSAWRPTDLTETWRSELVRLSSADRPETRLYATTLLDRLAPDDPSVEGTLRERVAEDADDDVFAAAALALLRRHPRDEALASDIAARASAAVNADDFIRAAGRALRTHRPGLPLTLAMTVLERTSQRTLLTDREVTEVLAEIAATGSATSVTIAQLSALATGASDYHGRHNALLLLDRLAPDDAETDALLRDRLDNDGDDDVFAAAATALLRRHPNDDTLPTVIADRAAMVGGRHADAAERVLSGDWPEDRRVPQIVNTGDLMDDAETSSALARLAEEGLEQAEIVLRLRTIATKAAAYQSRHNALLLIDRLAPDDPRTEALLRDRLEHDTDDDVFAAAATALLRRHPREETLPATIAERAQVLGGRFLTAGARVLTEHAPDHAATVSFEVTRSLSDGLMDADEVDAALDRLRLGRETDARSTLRALITGADSYQTRHNALLLLDRLTPDDPDTDALLRDRLEHDTDDDVFAAAATALFRRRPDDDTVATTVRIRADEVGGRFLAAAKRAFGSTGTGRPTSSLTEAASSSQLLADHEVTDAVDRQGDVDDRTVSALRRLAVEADAYQTRHNALLLVDRLTPDDPDTDALLRDRLDEDEDDDVFAAAALALQRRHPDDAALLLTITTRAANQGGRFLAAAARTLDAAWPGHPITRTLLADQSRFTAVLLDAAGVEAVIGQLADEQVNTAQVVPFLRASAEATDRTYQIRHNAVLLLDRIATADDDIEDLLRDRLEHDTDDDVFAAAATALLRRHPGSEEVLALMATRAREQGSRFLAAMERTLVDVPGETLQSVLGPRLGELPRRPLSDLPDLDADSSDLLW